MPSTSKLTNRPARRHSCGGPNRTGTEATNGQARRRPGRTTCSISQKANALVDAARSWLKLEGVADSSIPDKGLFIEVAIVVLARTLLNDNPKFELPPGISLDFIPAIKPNPRQESNG